MWRFGLFLAGMSALLLPSWVALPFGVSTAAAGLYLAWVRRGGGGEARKEEGDTFHDIGPSALATFWAQNPREGAKVQKESQAHAWLDQNRAKLIKFWKEQVYDIFIRNIDRGLPAHKNTARHAEEEDLANDYDIVFKHYGYKWTSLAQAKKDIVGTWSLSAALW